MTREQIMEFNHMMNNVYQDDSQQSLEEMLVEAEEDKKNGLIFPLEEVLELFNIDVY